jgi:uncharacterized protein YbjT (DUF2867 family)
MRVVLAGAFGHLGSDILRELVARGYDVVAVGRTVRDVEGVDAGSYRAVKADVCDPASLKGLCDGANCVVSTVGLVGASPTVTNYDIDYQGNMNLLREAEAAGVRRFAYSSVVKADTAPTVPMADAKARFEAALKASGLSYLIVRPSGYAYDMAKVFMPMVEKGKVTLLKKGVRANIIDTCDLARFMVGHLGDEGSATYEIGGPETYTYEQIARMFFEAAGKKPSISYAPAILFDVLARKARRDGNGKEAIIRFSKWTLTEDMVGDVSYGTTSFADYIKGCYGGGGPVGGVA